MFGALALGTACDAIQTLSGSVLEEHDELLLHQLLAGLDAFGEQVVVHRMFPDLDVHVGIACLTFPRKSPAFVAAALSAEHAIGVRHGTFCAHPLVDRLLGPGGGLRVSIGLGTSSEDIDAFLQALPDALSGATRHRYAKTDGQWAPVDDPRRVPHLAGLLDPAAAASPCAPTS